jgi:hypothetical protein
MLRQVENNLDEDLAQAILRDEVSDEAVEAAAFVALGGLPTLPNTYCFACPSDKPSGLQNRDLRYQFHCNVVR